MPDSSSDLPHVLAPEDAALAARIRAGDTEASGVLVDTHFNAAMQVAFWIVRSRDAAKDIARKVFAALWEHRARFHPTRSIRSYLLTATRNQAANAVRHARIQERYRDAAMAASEQGSHAPGVSEAETVENRITSPAPGTAVRAPYIRVHAASARTGESERWTFARCLLSCSMKGEIIVWHFMTRQPHRHDDARS